MGFCSCTVQASNGKEYRCDMGPDGLEIIDELGRYVTEVNGQGGSGVWKLHTELTLAEDVTCWEIDLPAAWRKLCILTKEGSLPICRDANGNKTTYQITASTAEKLNADGSSHFAYMRNDRVWCLVDRMGENNYTAITSSYATKGNSGFTPATAAAKIESTFGVDFHHIVVHS